MKVWLLGCKDYPAFSTPWVHSGGMEVYAERMVRSLADRASFTFLSAAGRSDEAARVVPLGAARGLVTQPVTLLFRSLVALRARPDADVLNTQTPLSALAAWWVERRFWIPYVVTVHIFAAEPSHSGGRAGARGYEAVQRLAFSRASAIIPTGRRLGEALAARHPSAAAKIKVVTAAGGGPVETAPRQATRRRLGASPEAPCLLFLGRLVEENRMEELVAALGHLRAGGLDAELWIAGTGDREESIRALVTASGLTSAVRWLGAVRGEERFDLLAAADLMVRTSRHEVYPEAYLEALAAGTPVAATPAGDTPDLAEESGAVALLPFGDPQGQAAVLRRILVSREERHAMRARALDHARRVTWNDRKERYFKILSRTAQKICIS